MLRYDRSKKAITQLEIVALGDHYQNGGRIGDAVVRLGFAPRKTVELVAAEYIAAQNRSFVAA